MTVLIIGVLASSVIGFFTASAIANVRIEDLQRENSILKKRISGGSRYGLGENTVIEHAQIIVQNYLNPGR